MSKQQCGICGQWKEQHEMSKSYKQRCKECVARLTRIARKATKQRAEHIKEQLEGTGYNLTCLREDRLRVATAAMQGILSNEQTMQIYTEMAQNPPYPKLFEIVARNAMGYADALLTKIDEKGDNYGQE